MTRLEKYLVATATEIIEAKQLFLATLSLETSKLEYQTI